MSDLIKILESIANDAENLSANALRERCYETIRQLQGGKSRPLSRVKRVNFYEVNRDKVLKLKKAN